jgi:hypothetical protein
MPRISGWLPSKPSYSGYRVFLVIDSLSVLQLLGLDVMGDSCICQLAFQCCGPTSERFAGEGHRLLRGNRASVTELSHLPF